VNDARDALDRHYATYRRESPYDDLTRRYTFQTFKPFLRKPGSSALELGCSDGLMTQMIAQEVGQVCVVEGSSNFLRESLARNISNASFVHSLFEEFQATRQFDYIFATFVLTHIGDLNHFFGKVRALLAPDGLLFIAVPNARVLSRQLALRMGLLEDLLALSENDRNHGHCRTYDRVRLNRELTEHGFSAISEGGVLLKPLADFQMDQLIEHKILQQRQIDGLYSLGLEYPDYCGTLFSVCTAKR